MPRSSSTASMKKRTRDNVLVPEGFEEKVVKVQGQDTIKLGWANFVQLEVSNARISQIFFSNMEDDTDATAATVKINATDLSSGDLEVIKAIDASIAECAAENDRKHSPLYDSDKNTVKIKAFLTLAGKVKKKIKDSKYHITTVIMPSFLYDYHVEEKSETWLGANLIVPRSGGSPGLIKIKPVPKKKLPQTPANTTEEEE